MRKMKAALNQDFSTVQDAEAVRSECSEPERSLQDLSMGTVPSCQGGQGPLPFLTGPGVTSCHLFTHLPRSWAIPGVSRLSRRSWDSRPCFRETRRPLPCNIKTWHQAGRLASPDATPLSPAPAPLPGPALCPAISFTRLWGPHRHLNDCRPKEAPSLFPV